jgi:NitT/TauT family transport system permease protein
VSAALKRAAPRALTALPLLLALAAWQVVGSRSHSIAFFFSTPTGVVGAAAEMVSQDAAWLIASFNGGARPDIPDNGLVWNAVVTSFEAVSGFLIGNLIGASAGIGLWYSQSGARMARPYLVALGALPVFAIAPMTILWFGIGIGAKVMLATLSTVFIAASQAYKGAEQVDPLLLMRFRSFGAGRRVIFRRLLLPSALSWIIASLRLTIGAALMGAFVGEFIASEHGLGHLILKASGVYDTPRVLVGIAAMIAIAMTLDAAVGATERHLLSWRGEGGREHVGA